MFDLSKPDRSYLLKVLWDIQKKKRCIDAEELDKVAQAFDISRTELDGIVSFYHFFHTSDAGRFAVYLDNSIIAEFAGRAEVRRAFEEAAGTQFGRVSPDGMFGLFETSCIGLSDQSPACLINFRPFTRLDREKVFRIVSELRSGRRPSEICDRVELNLRYTPPAGRTVFFKPYERFSALRALRERSPEEVLETVKRSKLAGSGGAFFPTGIKWELCRGHESDVRYLICNADEGEPGTFKDRALLQEHPELVVEGMILGAYAIGARHGAIYLRAEYMYLEGRLREVLAEYRSAGYLGDSIGAKEPFGFEIYVHLGAGAYVCGEETALIHSMEGRRGEPGTKEYFPVERGFKGKPTAVNNVETLAAVPRIFEMGVERWLSIGTNKTPGTKVLSLSGDCERPGIYEVEWGMRFDELFRLAGAREPRMVQLSGPSGRPVAVRASRSDDPDGVTYTIDGEFNRTLAGEDTRCGGSVMFFGEGRDILRILKSYSDFFVAESCGICVPCRTGNYLLNKKLGKLMHGHGQKYDLQDILSWSKIIKTTSRCGLGQAANDSLIESIAKFPEVFDAALAENTDFSTAFDLGAATAEYDRIIGELNISYD